jgi:maltokinase
VGFVVEDVAAWVVQQRWYAGKSHTPRFSILDAQPAHGAKRYLLMDHAGTPATLYQVPLADADGSIVDATHDHGFAVGLLAEMGVDTSCVTGSRVMTGEQSNTSIVYDEDGSPTVIVKLFRALHHGENPDVAVQRALSAVGSPFVPRFLGSLDAEWPDSGRPSGVAHGTVAFAQEFLPGARDGWSIAVEEARDGRGFGEAAHDLGVAVAGVHAALAATLPTRAGHGSDATAAASVWRRRLTIASAEVVAVAERRSAIDAIYRTAARSAWPRLQRVHGDLHLGQVLAVPGGGWRLVDFEGEPLRPMAERAAPDLPLRDIAGMLRSFDYAGIVGGGPGGTAWASEARAAFLAAYAAEPGAAPVDDILLRALVLDKAVYETVYEARNRPDWLPIPLAGIDAALT